MVGYPISLIDVGRAQQLVVSTVFIPSAAAARRHNSTPRLQTNKKTVWAMSKSDKVSCVDLTVAGGLSLELGPGTIPSLLKSDTTSSNSIDNPTQ
jgi:hypothetical protein